MIETNLNEAIHELEQARVHLRNESQILADLKVKESKLLTQIGSTSKRVEELQVNFDKAMLNMRKIMSGRESEVEVLVATSDDSDQVGREG